MNTADMLWQAARSKKKGALPILSFPAVQKMGITVRQLVNSSEYQAQAMKLVADEVPALASVSLMDLSVEAQAFGADVHFADDEVPNVTGQLVDSREAADALRVPTVGEGRTGLCVEALRRAKRLITDRPVLAGVIGPFSLVGRLCDVTEIMYLCYDEPEMVQVLLDKATDFLVQYALAFRDAGVDGVMMAEPLAGLLSPDLNAEFSTPWVQRIVQAVQRDDFAVIYHNCGNAVDRMLPAIFSVGAAAYHFGNAVSMREILDAAPRSALCMGNIDPAGYFAGGTPEGIAAATRALMQSCGSEPNFIPSSGCDIPPAAKWENIHAFFAALAS